MKHWIQAARLRTLPLSVSGILVGSIYALANTPKLFNWQIFILALLTTTGFQVLSNFANDYGDGVKGTDNQDRIGPKRAIQSGTLSVKAMKKAITITTAISLLLALVLIYISFKNSPIGYTIFFVLLGIACIVAAIKYTVGNSAYGYKGLGDLFVFLFFGLVSTLGSNFLYTQQLNYQLILPAAAIGLLSTGVLNLNNMRDEVSDRKAKKYTLVVQMGTKRAKNYHYFLVLTPMVLLLIFAIIYNNTGFSVMQYLFVAGYFPLLSHLKTVYYTNNPQQLDPELKKLALTTFLIALLLALALLVQ